MVFSYKFPDLSSDNEFDLAQVLNLTSSSQIFLVAMILLGKKSIPIQHYVICQVGEEKSMIKEVDFRPVCMEICRVRPCS